ncbi:MAG: hypothetical protein U1B94_03270 [candidate division NC10 bacterium]|nr:hypothetical protein [candidate division NC10 bacterium]
MAEFMTEQELRERAIRALEEHLGPVEALRFLGLVSREPFDYQEWRKRYFADRTVEELFQDIRESHTGQ